MHTCDALYVVNSLSSFLFSRPLLNLFSIQYNFLCVVRSAHIHTRPLNLIMVHASRLFKKRLEVILGPFTILSIFTLTYTNTHTKAFYAANGRILYTYERHREKKFFINKCTSFCPFISFYIFVFIYVFVSIIFFSLVHFVLFTEWQIAYLKY